MPARRPPRPAPGALALTARWLAAEWRHHPWRQAAAVIAVALGVALAFAVHLINASALAEFEAAVHASSGAPDFSLRARVGPLSEDWYPRVARAPGVALASPVVEFDARLLAPGGRTLPVHGLGLDALIAPRVSPGWLPRAAEPAPDADPDVGALDPDRVFLNAAARAWLGPAATVTLQAAGRPQTLAVGGRVDVGGPPLLVMDIAGAQASFGQLGALSRIDVRLRPGARAADVLAALGAGDTLRAAAPDEAALRMARLSQSYRVNLTVLSLVALFTGGFLVFSVQSLAVAQRIPQLALLGVLGMDARGRRRLVRADSLALGLLGAALGVGLGTLLALAGLRAAGGDLGSGRLSSAPPRLHWDAAAALVYAALGLLSALAGGWWPARDAEGIAPAEALKGLSHDAGRGGAPALAGPLLIALSAACAALPAWHSVPWGAYLGVAALLLGGISLVPQTVALTLRAFRDVQQPVIALALARAIDQRRHATAAVAGVVASLSLVVALTVMVDSFRDSLVEWLDQVLPADVVARPAQAQADGGGALFGPAVLAAVARAPQVQAWWAERLVPLLLSPDQPEAMLIARDPPAPGAPPHAPWIDVPPCAAARTPAAMIAVYASEVLAARQRLHCGDRLRLPLPRASAGSDDAAVVTVDALVQGIWRDYARQQGALLMDRTDWLRLTRDPAVSDLALWLRLPPAGPRDGAQDDEDGDALTQRADVLDLGRRMHAAAPDAAPPTIASSGRIRRLSLRIFDRSFAITRWLQAVALAIGLAGIAASHSAQVLARRREFGSLMHLGFTRRQVLWLVTLEGALWSAVGALLGVVLGLAVSVVLVKVVNPQSFHWTMAMHVAPATLAGLAAAVVLAGTVTAWASGHAAASRDMLRAVQEDW